MWWTMSIFLLSPFLLLDFYWFGFEGLWQFLGEELEILNWGFVLTVLFVTWMVQQFSKVYMSHSNSVWIFNLWLNLFVFSMVLLLLSRSWWVLFLGWELLGLTSFWLVAFYGSWVAHNGSLLTFLTNRLGDACLLSAGGYWLSDLLSSHFYYFHWILWMLLWAGLMTKSAQFPFCSWLPAAMAAPTPISSLVHSSTLVTAGLYLLMKFSWVKLISSFFSFWIGIFTLLIGSFTALLDLDLKKVIAFSTLSQLGLIFFIFSTKDLSLVFYHLMSHAFFKSSLFISVGLLILSYYSTQSGQVYSSFGLNSSVHFTWFSLTLVNLASLFYVSGFYSKELTVQQSITILPIFSNLLLVIIFSLTFMYSFRLFKSVSFMSSHGVVIKNVFLVGLIGSLINLSLILFMGYCWAFNFIYLMFDSSFYFAELMTLWLLPLLFTSFFIWMIYYPLTQSLKIQLKFQSFESLSSELNLFYLPSFIGMIFSWPMFTFLIFSLILLFW